MLSAELHMKYSSNLRKGYVCMQSPENCILNDRSGANLFLLRDFDLKSSVRI